MINFKNFYLQERDFQLEGELSNFDITYRIKNKQIPISNTLKKILDIKQNKNEKYYHITDIEGLKELFKIEKRSKSISAMKKNPTKNEKLVEDGICSRGGIVVELEGDILLSALYDIYTVPDSQGRRWSELKNIFLMQNRITDKFEKELEKWQEDNFEKLWKKYGEYTHLTKQQITQDKSKNWEMLVDIIVNPSPHKKELKKIQGKIKREITSEYIDFVYNHVKKYKKSWIDALKSTSAGEHNMYDEAVINNIEVKKVYIVNAYYFNIISAEIRKIEKKYNIPWEMLRFE